MSVRLDSVRFNTCQMNCLTVAGVAALLNLNQQTIRNMIDRGELGSVRVGQRRIRVRQSQLDAFFGRGRDSRARHRR